MRIIVLTNSQGNQKALIHKLSKVCDISAVVFSDNIPRRKPKKIASARGFVNSVGGRFLAPEFRNVWNKALATYEDLYSGVPASEILRVDNVNDVRTKEAIERHAPDLVVVSGTNLVGGRVISTAQRTGGIVNLHTGISPYVKGGPNCTNWCLAKGWFHLIGNTIMWLDKGIDTGNIIATERTPLAGDESLFEVHWKVMEHAHDLYVRAVERIKNRQPVASVPQAALADGVEFRSVQWNVLEMRRALRNFRLRYRQYFEDPTTVERMSGSVSLVSLNHG